MSLEAKIAELCSHVNILTDAVHALTLAMSNHAAMARNETPIIVTDIDASKVTEVRVADSAVTEIVPNESSTPASGAQSEPEPQTSLTYDDVKRATNNLSAAKGKEVTIAALAHFGVTRATQLVEAQWDEYIAYCQKAAA